MKFLTNLFGNKQQAAPNPEISDRLAEAIRIAKGRPDRELQAARKQLANRRRVAALSRTNIDQNDNHQKETTIMADTETKPVELTGKQPPELAIEEREGLLHIKIRGREFVATEQMLAQGQFLPLENIEGVRRYFDGQLIFWPDQHATWLDGTVETRVRLVTLADHYSFIEKDGFIEVPEPIAKGWPDLAWIVAGDYQLVDGREFPSKDREDRSESRWYYDPAKLGAADMVSEEIAPNGLSRAHETRRPH